MSQLVPGSPSGHNPVAILVGRQRERDRLRWLLTTAQAGGAALVLLDGETGIGKTTPQIGPERTKGSQATD
jgi:hypothetical protein